MLIEILGLAIAAVGAAAAVYAAWRTRDKVEPTEHDQSTQ